MNQVSRHLVHWHCSIFLTSEALAKEVVLLVIDELPAFNRPTPQQQQQDKAKNQVFVVVGKSVWDRP